MPLSSRQLVDFLEEVDGELERKIKLVAAGGTAMTLYRLKPSTVDVDFTGPMEDIELFEAVSRRLQPGFRIDTWPDGQVFSQFLPADYLEKSERINARRLKKIELRALQPLDIVATKIGRLDGRDLDDIKACIRARRLSKRMIVERAGQTQYAGNRGVYEHNLRTVTTDLFRRSKRSARLARRVGQGRHKKGRIRVAQGMTHGEE